MHRRAVRLVIIYTSTGSELAARDSNGTPLNPTLPSGGVSSGLLIGANQRVRGVNHTPTFNGMGGAGTADDGSVWTHMWRVWDWAGREQPQLADGAAIANCVRTIGSTHVVTSGAITLSTYLARWTQFLDYADSLGLWVYPCGGAFNHWGHATTSALAHQIYGELASLLDTYDNIVGFDIANETWGSMHPNNFSATVSYDEPQDYRDLCVELVDTVHTNAPGLPVTCSFSLNDNSWWNWDGPVGNEWAILNEISDFLDYHIYTPTNTSYAASVYQMDWAFTSPGVPKHMVIGEFGGADPGGSNRVSAITEVKSIVEARTDNDGALYWGCWDLGTTASTLAGLYNGSRVLRTDISNPFATLPTTR